MLLLSQPLPVYDPRGRVACRRRRCLPKITSHGLVDDAISSSFYNREAELQAMNKALSPTARGAPGKLLLLLGPRDSGKTALIREFRRRQEKGSCRGVSTYVDLRQGWEPKDFAANLNRSFLDSFSGKFSLGGFSVEKTADGISLKTPVLTEAALKFSRQSDIRGVLEEIEKYGFSWKNMFRLANRGYHFGFPTIFIDEANLLSDWTTSTQGINNLRTLLTGLVRISKQECAANVVLVSSDSLFREWLRTMRPLKGSRLSYGTIGHFSKEESKGFLETMVHPCAKGQLEEVWEDVFSYVGGSIMVLWDVVHLFNSAMEETRPLAEVWKEWKKNTLRGAIAFLKDYCPDATLPAPKWSMDDWKKAIELMAKAPDGVVPYATLTTEISKAAVDSLIEHDVVNYRVWTGWDKDINVERERWPIVMPYNKQFQVAMQHVVAKGW